MTFKVLTLFPEVLSAYLRSSIIGRAVREGKINVEVVDFRTYADTKHRKVDDTPYGGGSGMLLCCEPLHKALLDLQGRDAKVVFLSPSGALFNQEKAFEFAHEKELVLVCGFYEGFDARVFELVEHEKVSIGDYILTNGTLASLVVVDVVARLCKDVVQNPESLIEESFTDSVLEYDQYTRPREYRGLRVPELLLEGNHERIRKYRRRSSLLNTLRTRPDVFESLTLRFKDLELLFEEE